MPSQDSSDFRQKAPPPIVTTSSRRRSSGNGSAGGPEERMGKLKIKGGNGTPPPPPARLPPKIKSKSRIEPKNSGDSMGDDDALLDLEQLEELYSEAERMKALGNKHMAAQEYTRAYNAYSAALQLSPVGPSSHVFLSNRAAALLSLKRYSAAATDARRAVALAPTFGKAHARLGQSLYFLKDYQGAVAAYEEAIEYEPDNKVTITYLEKAKLKLQRQAEKAARAARGDEVTVGEEGTVADTVVNSIATDPNASAAVVTSGFQNDAVVAAAAGSHPKEIRTTMQTISSPARLQEEEQPNDGDEEDPDFDEAVLIQERANKFLSNKQYKRAIEEYSAALFLVPDDPYLSPELHLGRAHALNGLRRHESARNDAQLALKWNATAEAYSTLAKSLFYMKEYRGSVDAFKNCVEVLPEGETLSMFDRLYLEKAEAALDEEPEDARSVSSVIPKLPPPRFVPREQAINSTQNMPPAPKSWPQQSQRSPSALQCGPEREVTFISESLGIKLNRGTDGIVRVIAVAPETPGSPLAREGTIEVGDVVREAAGVDIRRPITNIMWGDTVALIKLAPRPITFVVAKETSSPPPTVIEELEAAKAEAIGSPARMSISRGEEKEDEERYYYEPPSPANGDESVKDSIAAADEREIAAENAQTRNAEGDGTVQFDDTVDFDENVECVIDDPPAALNDTEASSSALDSTNAEEQPTSPGHKADNNDNGQKASCPDDTEASSPGLDSDNGPKASSPDDTEASSPGLNSNNDDEQPSRLGPKADNSDNGPKPPSPEPPELMPTVSDDGDNGASLETEVEGLNEAENEGEHAEADEFEIVEEPPQPSPEIQSIGAEIVFEQNSSQSSADGWTNARWLSTSGVRKLRHCADVYRLVQGRKGLFRSGEQYVPRKLALFDYPNLFLILRAPRNLAEMREVLGIPDGVDIAADGTNSALKSFLVAETVINTKACKLRLSPLSTVTSIESIPENDNPRRRTCFELLTPSETILLSAVPERGRVKKDDAFTDGAAFLETSLLEVAVGNALYAAHSPEDDNDSEEAPTDVSWKHQIILGTLHSFVIAGNQTMLENAIRNALANQADAASNTTHASPFVSSRVIDAKDESGQTALHYACSRRASQAVAVLVEAGADASIPTKPDTMYPCHLSARNLDEKSLSTILSASKPTRPDPNALDSFGRTPMYIAAVEGQTVGGGRDSGALGHCLAALEAWGGQMLLVENETSSNKQLRHPVSVVASEWRSGDLAEIFPHVPYRYPFRTQDSANGNRTGISLDAAFHYPVHSALVSFRRQVGIVGRGGNSEFGKNDAFLPESKLVSTLRILFEHGFEPNERLEDVSDEFEGAEELASYTGYTPLQILAVAALEAHVMAKEDVAHKLFEPATMECIMDIVAETATFLVQNGARLSVDQPPTSRVTRRASALSERSSSEISVESAKSDDVISKVDRSSLKLDSHKIFIKLFGGEERLKSAKKIWAEVKATESTGKIQLHGKPKEQLPDSEAPGGSDEKSCAICWKAFGSIRNRKHTCRVTNRYVCDDCSSKRIIQDGQEHRISDGQFLVARVDSAKQVAERLEEEREKERIRKARVEKALSERRSQLTRVSEEEERDTLFGGVMEKAANFVFGEEEQSAQEQTRGIAESLGQTRDALNERGEKLNSLSEKTARLKDASADFARMAKELEQSQRSFW